MTCPGQSSGSKGFTLVELLIVMVIIGILISFVIKASMGGIRTSEIKATEALVAKLEQAMTDRWDALTTIQADPTPAHYTMAAIYPAGVPPIQSTQRAQVIAQYDYLRAQVPDVFGLQLGNANYPINFAGAQFNGIAGDEAAMLPIGNTVGQSLGGSWKDTAPVEPKTPGTGIYGASYEIAGGIYKQLGYNPQGYDGNDNNGNGLVDEMIEGGMSAAEVAAKLNRHQHKTARSEMLYAILVEGGGTYGSAFNKDDFTSREVQDTDGDGLMEFVDAWGEPLQFYRWPILYRSDLQKGYPDTAKLASTVAGQNPGPYTSVTETREQNPLDPNQTLLAPAWWGAKTNKAVWPSPQDWGGNVSRSASAFMDHFGPCLIDPLVITPTSPSPSNSTYWDRSLDPNPTTTGPLYPRRAYYSRFLILSGGPDKTPGTAMLTVNYAGIDDRATIETPSGTASSGTRDGSGAATPITVQNLLIESQGGRVDPARIADSFGRFGAYGAGGRNDTNSQLEYFGQDDISNQNLQATGGVVQ